jgi:DNA-binding LytR/AlgR family response regulator
MINLVTIDDHDDENDLIHKVVDECIFKMIGNEDFEYVGIKKANINQVLQDNKGVDFCCYDVSVGMDLLYDLRKRYPLMNLLLVVEMSMSPTEYLKPGIKPDAILIRPVNPKNASDTLEIFLSEGLSQRDSSDRIFVVDGREGKYTIPYNKIYYFESREKKIYIKTIEGEYGFYGTIDELEGELSEMFVRCHRSFIVNKKYIRKISNITTIELSNGFMVPVSRSYRQTVKELKWKKRLSTDFSA